MPPLSGEFAPYFCDMGDQNNDGIPDLAIIYEETNQLTSIVTSELRIISGADGSTIVTHLIPLGPIAKVDDYDGDGLPDILVGRGLDVVAGVGIAGIVRVHSSVTGASLARPTNIQFFRPKATCLMARAAELLPSSASGSSKKAIEVCH